MSNEEISSSEYLISGISALGKGKLLRSSRRIEAMYYLKKGIKLLNKAVALDPNNLEYRKVRIRHFHGVTLHSPISLIKIIKDDLDFLIGKYNTLTDLEKGLYFFINGEYFRLNKNLEKAKESYFNCVSISPGSMEALEAQDILDNLYRI